MKALAIIAAFAAGGACGVLATKLYFQDKYRHMADSEIESVIDIYRKKTEELEKKYQDKESLKEEKRSYDKQVENYISSAPLDAVIDREAAEKTAHPEDDEPEEQYQITSMDFFDDSEYDKVNLTYYINDEALVGPSDKSAEDILDIGSTIGQDAIDLISNGFDDGSALYIRNPKLGTDYEVTKSYISYKDLMTNG